MIYPELQAFDSTDDQHEGVVNAMAKANVELKASGGDTYATPGGYIAANLSLWLDSYASQLVSKVKTERVTDAFAKAQKGVQQQVAALLNVDLTIVPATADVSADTPDVAPLVESREMPAGLQADVAPTVWQRFTGWMNS